MVDMAKYKNRHGIKYRIGRVVWSIVWTLACRWTPQGVGFLYWWRNLWLRLFGAKIGRGVHVYPSACIWQPWFLEMGDYSCLANSVDCYSAAVISIGRNAVVSQGAYLCAASHDISSLFFELEARPIVIGDNVWVAARSVVLPGVRLGEGAVVAAGAVVSRDVDPWVVVAGNPARSIKMRKLERAYP